MFAVGSLLHFMEMGPSYCQQANNGSARNCVFPYIQQLLGIRLLSTYYLGIATLIEARCCSKSALGRNGDTSGWAEFKSSAWGSIVFAVTLVGSFHVFGEQEMEEMLGTLLSPFGYSRTFAFAITGSLFAF